jgi:hypothetical protein
MTPDCFVNDLKNGSDFASRDTQNPQMKYQIKETTINA